MLSFSLLSCPAPPKSFHFSPIRPLPTSKDPILIRGSPLERDFCRRIGRLGVSVRRSMTELAGVGAFRGGSGGGIEAEAILGGGSPALESKLEWRRFESILNRMSKWLVAGLFALFILWRHDAEAMWAATGSVVNSWISITLKKILNHERPNAALRSDPGMPSSHAQSIFYTACFAVFSLFHWLGVNMLTASVASTILICGSYFTWLRVSQKLHTISQVAVGAVLGAAFGIAWFWMWHSLVLRAFIAFIWVRIIVVLGSIAFCAGFLVYVIQNWLNDE